MHLIAWRVWVSCIPTAYQQEDEKCESKDNSGLRLTREGHIIIPGWDINVKNWKGASRKRDPRLGDGFEEEVENSLDYFCGLVEYKSKAFSALDLGLKFLPTSLLACWFFKPSAGTANWQLTIMKLNWLWSSIQVEFEKELDVNLRVKTPK